MKDEVRVTVRVRSQGLNGQTAELKLLLNGKPVADRKWAVELPWRRIRNLEPAMGNDSERAASPRVSRNHFGSVAARKTG